MAILAVAATNAQKWGEHVFSRPLRGKPAARRSRGVAVGIVALAASVALTACGTSNSNASSGTSSGSGSSGGTSQDFVVGAVEPLTGVDAAAGIDIVNALKAQAEILNAKGGILGHQIKVVAVDSGSSEQQSISATQQLVANNKLNMFEPDVIFGQADLPFATGLLSLAICAAPDCGNGQKYPLEFTLNPPASTQVPPVLAYAKQQGDTKMGIIATNDAQGQSFSQSVQSDASAFGVQVTKVETFDPAATDITTQMQALRASGAQVVASWSAGTSVDAVMTAMENLGWSAKVVGTPTVFTSNVSAGVPKAVQSQLLCLCYAVGTRQGSSVVPAEAPLVSHMEKFGTIASMQVAGLAADTLTMASYGYTKAGKLDAKAAAAAIDSIGSDASYPASSFYAYSTVNPGFHGTVHSPADAKLNNGFFAVASVSPVVSGTYLGQPFSWTQP